MIRHDEFFVIVFEHVYTYHDDTSKIITVPLQLTDFGVVTSLVDRNIVKFKGKRFRQPLMDMSPNLHFFTIHLAGLCLSLESVPASDCTQLILKM